jgi:Protein of unknown function (DUF1579)
MRIRNLVIGTLIVAASAYAAVRFQEMPQPTAEHREIVKAVGAWEGTLTSYMPGQPEQTMPAKETIEAIGGFWTQSRFETSFGGQPYVGTGCVGYDSQTKKYVGTWIDSMSEFFSLMEGEKDAKTGAIVMRYMAPDMESGKLVPHRIETVHGTDTYTSSFFMGDGAGTKTMVIAMKRKMAAKAGN